MESTGIIDSMFLENRQLLEVLNRGEEYSLAISVDSSFRKVLVLAAASYFETRVTSLIIDFCNLASKGNVAIQSFVRNKALNRQYHTLFDWDRKNANRFWGFFGDEFKERAGVLIGEQDVKQAVEAFMEIGSLRNELIHTDFAQQSLGKTTEEVYQLYRNAVRFLSLIDDLFKECLASGSQANG